MKCNCARNLWSIWKTAAPNFILSGKFYAFADCGPNYFRRVLICLWQFAANTPTGFAHLLVSTRKKSQLLWHLDCGPVCLVQLNTPRILTSGKAQELTSRFFLAEPIGISSQVSY